MTNYNENNKVNKGDYERDTTKMDNSVVTPNFNTNENSISGATITVNEIDYKDKRFPIIGGLSATKQYSILLTSFVLGLSGIGYSFYQDRVISIDKNAASNAALTLNTDLKLFETAFNDVVVGKSEAFNLMLAQRDSAVKAREEFEKIAEKTESERMKSFVVKLNKSLDGIRENVEQITKEKNFINDMEVRVEQLKSLISAMQVNLDIIQESYVTGGMSQKN